MSEPEADEPLVLAALTRRLRAADRVERCEAAKVLFEHFRAPLRRHIRCELARRQRQAPPIEIEAFHSGVETHVNSALLKLLERLDKGPLGEDDELQFLAYLKAIVRNALATRRRREQRNRAAPLLDELQTAEPPVLERLGEEEERAREEKTLAERRQRLSSAEQQLLDMYAAGLSHRQIAEQLGGTPGQYRARMGRILRKLR